MSIAQSVKGLLFGLLIIGLFVLARTLPLAQWIEELMRWVDRLGVWAPLVFGLLYIVATVLMVPGSVITVAAGAVFGLFIGTMTVSLASTAGATLAFLIARYLIRDKIAQSIERHPKFDAVDQAIGKEGWKIVALLRLSPVVPFNLQNYLYGLTAIQLKPYVLASWVAMLPGTFMYVYLGYLGRVSLEAVARGEIQHGPIEWAMLVVGLLATVAVTWYVTRLARRAIKERMEAEEAKEAPDSKRSPVGLNPHSTNER
jgi:uncharacterized membrane protein YdjX (TVP38/TMEM64 family)